jgi:TolB-like protein
MKNEFGAFRYDPEQRVLFREGEALALMPKAVDTLHVLLERRGRVVEKAELMKLVWPDTSVEEIGLARNISLLRKALGDEADTYIETIPKRGYRFRAEAAPEPTRRRWWMAGLAAAGLAFVLYWQFYRPSRFLPEGRVSMATVPFEALTGDTEVAVLSRSLDEGVVAELSKLRGVQVVAPSTVQRYRWLRISTGMMLRVLGLQVLLEGTVSKAGERAVVTARLVDVNTGRVIWAESYADGTDPGLARAIAGEVGAHLSIDAQFSP